MMRHKCDFCENSALHAGSRINATEEEKRTWKDSVQVCGEHVDRENHDYVICFNPGRHA
ncbi:MAG: hypothetical protein K0Q50_230 [Vampirovibrio sp.]|jgi:hypothetical protein|nr:hypothetical protein [Vampirovibrio sp.]